MNAHLTDAEGWPGSLIIETHDLVAELTQNLAPHNISLLPKQLAEIIAQILYVFLNGGDVLMGISQLPNFHTLHYADEYTEPQKQVIRQHVFHMSQRLLDRTMQLGAWKEGCFPYAFDHFVGHDVVLFHLPY